MLYIYAQRAETQKKHKRDMSFAAEVNLNSLAFATSRDSTILDRLDNAHSGFCIPIYTH